MTKRRNGCLLFIYNDDCHQWECEPGQFQVPQWHIALDSQTTTKKQSRKPMMPTSTYETRYEEANNEYVRRMVHTWCYDLYYGHNERIWEVRHTRRTVRSPVTPMIMWRRCLPTGAKYSAISYRIFNTSTISPRQLKESRCEESQSEIWKLPTNITNTVVIFLSSVRSKIGHKKGS